MPQKKITTVNDPLEMPPVHEAAELFPLIDGQAFNDLVENIKRHGLRDPIVKTSDGKILDGRNRYRACLAAGVEPTFRTWRGPGKAFQYVISVNLHRRHLTTSQRSMIAAQIATMEQGARTDLASNEAMSQPEAAEKFGVSRSSVQRGKHVIEEGTPELVTAVRDGDISLGAATEIVTLPREDQQEVVRQVKKGVKPAGAIAKTKKHVERHPQEPEPPTTKQGEDDGAISDLARECVKQLNEAVDYFEVEINDPLTEIRQRHAEYFDEELTDADDPMLADALNDIGGRVVELLDEIEAVENYLQARIAKREQGQSDGALVIGEAPVEIETEAPIDPAPSPKRRKK